MDFGSVGAEAASYERICNKNIVIELENSISVLKSLMEILRCRIEAFEVFFASLNKSKINLNIFVPSEGTLKNSFDLFIIFMEQELHQSRQQIVLNDIRKILGETIAEITEQLQVQQRNIHSSEKDVHIAERRVLRAKQILQKITNKKHM